MTDDGSSSGPKEQSIHGDDRSEEPPPVSQHHTLKYHLLGPSLTKAGQDSVDQRKVSEIIYSASKGSKFFNNEEVKDKNLTRKIEIILAKKRELEKLDLSHELRKADEYITELEASRDLSQSIVHIDCDAFYAAVEELDRPELRDVPMAVGKGVLTTCNYHARKYGCRSGMAGFVAMKLCPQLICLPLNFAKYTAKAQEVRAILAEYDPRFESASIDEAYLNVTGYCVEHDISSEDAVSQLRSEVAEKCRITISAGIAANGRLAKICSNKNKPNGQFRLQNEETAIMSFMEDLPTRKVNGIGRVFERELDAIGIKTCGDIYTHRMYLSRLFGEKAFQFLMQVYLGLGRTMVQPAGEYERKSVGTESTFRDMSGPDLYKKLRWIAEELEKDLARTQFKGRTLVLKIKLYTYEVYTRQTIPPKAVSTAEELYTFALPMLKKYEKERPGLRLRLMGLRCSHLVSTKKANVDFFGMGRPTIEHNGQSRHREDVQLDADGWEIWPDEDDQEETDDDGHSESESAERLSGDELIEEQNRRLKHGRPIIASPEKETERPKSEERWPCPICQRLQLGEDRSFNEHVDLCLSRQEIRDAISQAPEVHSKPTIPETMISSAKRGRKRKSETKAAVDLDRRKQYFFRNVA